MLGWFDRGRLRVSLSAQNSAQKSTQESKRTQKSAFLSKTTLFSAQKSAEKSGYDQKSAQERALLSDSLKKVLFWVSHSKERSKEGIAQKGAFWRRPYVLKKCSKKHSKE